MIDVQPDGDNEDAKKKAKNDSDTAKDEHIGSGIPKTVFNNVPASSSRPLVVAFGNLMTPDNPTTTEQSRFRESPVFRQWT